MQLLAAKEQRLRFLKAQDARGAAQAAEGERLRRLRERVEAQESKLRRLRALRGQVDLQKTYNVTLSEYPIGDLPNLQGGIGFYCTVPGAYTDYFISFPLRI